MSAPKIQSMAAFLEAPSRFLFFTGKGGVGKTTLACAMSVGLADRGRQVLLVSTDPASNLDEVLGQSIGPRPEPVGSVPGLSVMNVNPQAAARAYRERIVGPHRGQLPDAVIASMEEQLSGACVLEIAAFDEFSKLLGDAAATEAYDHVIFDTAPTGHTLRLLSLPEAWSGFIRVNVTGTSCLGPLAGLQKQRAIYEGAVAALREGTRTTVLLVSRPQKAALEEAARTSAELEALGIGNQRLILNGMFRASDSDPVARALERRGTQALAAAASWMGERPALEVPLQPMNLIGIPALRSLLGGQTEPGEGLAGAPVVAGGISLGSLSAVVDTLAERGRGVVLVMGKGGVGKTTLAAAVAMELARKGFPVHLSTTDPAAHVAAAASQVEGVQISRIDPKAETEAYTGQVLATAGKDLDAKGRALLEEDLRSPCTEEIAVFRAFARVVAQGCEGFVVLDTAPTGHTLLLLDATEAYHREVARKASDVPEEVRCLLPRLRDCLFTRILLVTLPEATPVHEAAALQEDLRRAGIEPHAWIINQSFFESGTTDPLLAARGQGEARHLREVTEHLANRTALVPWVEAEPVGPAGLEQLLQHKQSEVHI